MNDIKPLVWETVPKKVWDRHELQHIAQTPFGPVKVMLTNQGVGFLACYTLMDGRGTHVRALPGEVDDAIIEATKAEAEAAFHAMVKKCLE